MPPPNPPAGTAAVPTLSARRILAPVGVQSPELVWETQPGATFVAGSRLGMLRSEPADGEFAAIVDFLCLLLFLLTCGLWRLGRLVGEHVLTAPEDGVLLWLLPPASVRRLRRGEPLATYFPLREWQAYEQLLREQDAAIRERQAAALPALRAEAARLGGTAAALRQQLAERQEQHRRLLQGSIATLAEQLLGRQAELNPAALDAATVNTLQQMVRQLGSTIKHNCPLPPGEFFALCDEYLSELLILEERFRRTDADFFRRYRQVPSDSEKEQLLAAWQQRKEGMVARFGTHPEATHQLP